MTDDIRKGTPKTLNEAISHGYENGCKGLESTIRDFIAQKFMAAMFAAGVSGSEVVRIKILYDEIVKD